MKRFIALSIACALALGAFAGCSSPQASNNTPAQSNAEVEQYAENHIVTLRAQGPIDGSSPFVEFAEVVEIGDDSTVFDVLQNSSLEFTWEEGQYGVYVTSIQGIEPEGNTGWIYTVNDEEIMESVDSCYVKPEDEITFAYESVQS